MISKRFNTAFTSYRKTNAVDDGGAVTNVESSNVSGYLMLSALAAEKIIYDEKGVIVCDYEAYCPAVDILPGDRLKIDTTYYTVVSAPKIEQARNIFLRLGLRKVTPVTQ